MSYYTSSNPGFFAYIALTTASILGLLIHPQSTLFIGILSICWGIFVLIKILSLYEVSEIIPQNRRQEISKNNNHLTSSLAYDLTARMHNSAHLKHGKKALQLLDIRNLIWLSIAGAYALYTLRHGHENNTETIKNLSVFFIIGATFWNGQSYAYNKSTQTLLLALFTGLATFCLFYTTPYFNIPAAQEIFSNIKSLKQDTPTLILATLCLFCIIAPVYNSITSRAKYTYTMIAILIITVMALLYIVPTIQQSISLWISLWGLLSLFWFTQSGKTKQRFVLYQCQ